MITRAKFQLQEIRESFGNNGAKTFIFNTMYDQSVPENKRFFDATPWGKIEMIVNNPTVFDEFKLGDYFYADFTRAEK